MHQKTIGDITIMFAKTTKTFKSAKKITKKLIFSKHQVRVITSVSEEGVMHMEIMPIKGKPMEKKI